MTQDTRTQSTPSGDPATQVPIRTWDLPTRLLHWAMAGLFVTAMGLASLVSEHSPAFRWHMLAGLMLVGAVALRLLWGLLGSRYARFTSFLYGPAALMRYLMSCLKGTDAPQAGHNPGAAYAAAALILLPLALVASGLMMQGRKEAFEDLHKVLAYGMVAVVAAHLAGLGLHTLRHRDRTVSSMVSGRKLGLPKYAIPTFHPIPALAVVLLLGGWGAVLVSSFDSRSGKLTLPGTGTSIQLGEGTGRSGEPEEKDDD